MPSKLLRRQPRRDEYVVVTHATNAPGLSSTLAREQYAFDLYTANGTKVLEDVSLEGLRIVGSGEFLYVVESGPPDPWTVGVYRLTL